MSSLYHDKSIAFDSVAKIADYLDVSVDYLLGRSEKETGNRYNNIHDIGSGATIGENNTSIQNVSQNALEFDKFLSSLEYKEQIRLMSHIYDWVDELKKRNNAPLHRYNSTSGFYYNRK